MKILATASAALAIALASCSDEPTDLTPPKPSAIDIERLALDKEQCGEPAGVEGDTSFSAQVTVRDGDVSSMKLTLDVSVSLDSGHGDHEVSWAGTEAQVVDAGGTVVAVRSGIGVDEDGENAAVAMTFEACDAGASLPPGDYELVSFGTISPTDHVHGQQEYWVAESVSVTAPGD